MPIAGAGSPIKALHHRFPDASVVAARVLNIYVNSPDKFRKILIFKDMIERQLEDRYGHLIRGDAYRALTRRAS